MPPARTPAPWRWHAAWAVVFAANLGVPLRLGWSVTEDGGRAGMAAAVASLLLGSLLVVRWSGGVGRTLIAGGAFTAATQVWPLAQITTGLVAMDLVYPWSDRSDAGRGLTDAGAFSVTLLTGGQLLAVSLASGFALRAVARFTSGRWG